MKLKKAIIIAFVALTACSGGEVTDNFVEVDAEGWSYEDTIQTSFDIEDLGHYYQLYANLRIDPEFSHSNMQLKVLLNHPDNTVKEHLISIPVADKTGKWLGSGLGSIITYQHPILSPLEFKQKGTYSVDIIQNMRQDNWPHVHAAGLRVSKDKEVF